MPGETPEPRGSCGNAGCGEGIILRGNRLVGGSPGRHHRLNPALCQSCAACQAAVKSEKAQRAASVVHLCQGGQNPAVLGSLDGCCSLRAEMNAEI